MPENLSCEVISWEDFRQLCYRLAFQIRDTDFSPDMIVGIGRGGYMPTRMLSDLLQIRDTASFRVIHYLGPHKQPCAEVAYPLAAPIDGRRILLMDDVSDTGDTFRVALQHLNQSGQPREVRTAVLHHKTTARPRPDYFAAEISDWHWLLYPWAVTEDLAQLLPELAPLPADPQAIGRLLETRHGIRLPAGVLEHTLRLLSLPGQPFNAGTKDREP